MTIYQVRMDSIISHKNGKVVNKTFYKKFQVSNSFETPFICSFQVFQVLVLCVWEKYHSNVGLSLCFLVEMKMKLSRSDNHIIITMMKLSRCVLDSIFHQTNKKLVDSIFLAVLGVVCLQNEGAIIASRPQHNIVTVTVTIYKGPGQSDKIFLSLTFCVLLCVEKNF